MGGPPCEYFGVCGGCSLQGVEYGAQVGRKRRMLADALGFEDVEAHSLGEFSYRTRMDFAFHGGGLGFRRRGSWREFFDVESCMISNLRINDLLAELRVFFKEVDAFDPSSHGGTFRYAILRAPGDDSSVSFVLNKDSPRLAGALDRVRSFASSTSAENVMAAYVPSRTDASLSRDYEVVKGGDMLSESFLGKAFKYHIQGFFQNNHGVAELMHSYCRRLLMAHDTRSAHLLDLYGGAGTFGIVNSDLYRSVKIVESDPGCIGAARMNIEANGAGNAEAVLSDAKFLGRLDLPVPVHVITDPPRAGMHPKAVKRLLEMRPDVVVYVSCNVRQLAGDIRKFSGYDVVNAALFDMFPQTPHIEAVVELRRQARE
ncbi:MAG: hypothetical protein V1875_08725 [Candidatus Altiarchaeota archaeon]